MPCSTPWTASSVSCSSATSSSWRRGERDRRWRSPSRSCARSATGWAASATSSSCPATTTPRSCARGCGRTARPWASTPRSRWRPLPRSPASPPGWSPRGSRSTTRLWLAERIWATHGHYLDRHLLPDSAYGIARGFLGRLRATSPGRRLRRAAGPLDADGSAPDPLTAARARRAARRPGRRMRAVGDAHRPARLRGRRVAPVRAPPTRAADAPRRHPRARARRAPPGGRRRLGRLRPTSTAAGRWPATTCASGRRPRAARRRCARARGGGAAGGRAERSLRDRHHAAAEQAPRDVGRGDGAAAAPPGRRKLGQRARHSRWPRLHPASPRARPAAVRSPPAWRRRAAGGPEARAIPIGCLGRRVAIEVVPVRRPDALGEPAAGVAHLDPSARPGGEAGERGSGLQRDRSVDAGGRAVRPHPRAHERGVVVAGHDGERRARGPAGWPSARRTGSATSIACHGRPSASSSEVAEEHETLDAVRASSRAWGTSSCRAGRRGPGGHRGAGRRRRRGHAGVDVAQAPDEVVPRENPGHQPATPAAPERRRSTGTQCDEARGPRPTAAGRRGRSSAATFAASFHELCSRPAALRRRVQTSGASRAR